MERDVRSTWGKRLKTNKLNRSRLPLGPALTLMLGRSPRVLCNKSPPPLWLNTHWRSHSFRRWEVWAQNSWVLCSGSPNAETWVLAGPRSHLELRVHFTLLQVVGRTQLLVVVGLNPRSCWTSAGVALSSQGCSRVPVAHSVGNLQHGCALYQAKRRVSFAASCLFSGLSWLDEVYPRWSPFLLTQSKVSWLGP